MLTIPANLAERIVLSAMDVLIDEHLFGDMHTDVVRRAHTLNARVHPAHRNTPAPSNLAYLAQDAEDLTVWLVDTEEIPF